MKKLLATLFLIFTVLALSACGAEESEGNTSTGSDENGSEVFELVYANTQASDHPMNVAGQWMAEELEQRTDGRVTMEVFPDSVLGGPEELLQGMRHGDVDFAWITSAILSRYSDAFNLFNASYVIEGKEHYKNAFFERDTEVMTELDRLINEADLGSQMVGMLGGGIRHAYNGVRPIETPADLNGLKMRIQESEVHGQVWAALGANPVPMAYSEVYTGLQSNVIDGLESSISAYDTDRFYEVAPYLSLTAHEFNVGPMMMSNQRLEELPEDLREIVLEVAFEAGKLTTEEWWNDDEEILEKLKDDIEVNEVDTSEFAALTVPILEQVAKDNNAEELYEAIKAAK